MSNWPEVKSGPTGTLFLALGESQRLCWTLRVSRCFSRCTRSGWIHTILARNFSLLEVHLQRLNDYREQCQLVSV